MANVLTAKNVLDRAWAKAQDDGDTGPVRWPSDKAMRWLNDARREVVNLLPSSNPKFEVVAPVAGVSRQTFEDLDLADGLQVLEVTANYGADTETPGRAITLRDRKVFDDTRPNWRTEKAAEARHWFFNPQEPKAFDLYPAIDGTGTVGVLYSAAPVELTLETQKIGLDDIYANAVQMLVLAYFYETDTPFNAAPTKAAYYRQAAAESLGLKRSNTMMSAAQSVAASNAKGAQ